MSSEYYSLEKAAEVLNLPTAEINRLREKSLLRAFRDGSSWKFRKVDVDNYLAESIKSRSKTVEAGESDFDLLSMDDDAEEMPTLLADSASFDALMEDGLSLEGNMIDAAPPIEKAAPIDDGLTLADDLTLDDDGLSLSEDDALSLSDDSAHLTGSDPVKSDIDLAIDDDLALDAGGSSGQLDLAGDSGLSLLDIAEDVELQPVEKGGSDIVLELADDDDILSLVDEDLAAENTSTIAIPVEDDFQLTPDTGPMIGDDSDSASQVIALEEDGMFGSPISSSEFGEVESPFGAAAPAPEEQAAPAGGFGIAGSPFGATASPGDFAAAAGPAYAVPTHTEAHYSPLLVTALVFVAALLALPGVMLLDLIIHIWSWNEPFVINSSIMDLVCGMVGLK